MATEHVRATAMGSWAEDVCARVHQALQREGRTVDQLFEALAGGGSGGAAEVHFPDFRALFAQLEPTLSDGQLRRLWQLFDKNGDGGVSRTEFLKALGGSAANAPPDASAGMAPAPVLHQHLSVAPAPVLLSRVGRALGTGKLPPRQALQAYGSSSGLDLHAWLDACRGLKLPLSRQEATALHAELARGPGGGVLRPETLEAEATRASNLGVPEERWAREFVSGRAQLAQDAGGVSPAQAVETVAAGAEAIDESAIRAALGRHCAVPDEQWAQLRLLLDRRLEDGLVLWRPFLQWSCALGTGASAKLNVSDGVCTRVAETLRGQGKTADQLFDALAGVKDAVHWPDFRAFFAQFQQDLSNQQLEQLWQTFDKDGDGSVSREEFTRTLGVVDSAAKAATAQVCLRVAAALQREDVCVRVTAALEREGKSIDSLFTALAGGKQEVTWPDFRALFAQLEPGLLEQHLLQLWKTFDKNGDGGVSRDEFLNAMTNVKSSALQDVCVRVTAALEREGKSIGSLFTALAGGKQEVTWPDFRALFAQLEPALLEEQLAQLWKTFDKNGDGGVSRDEFLNAMTIVKSSVLQDVCVRVTAALEKEGKSIDSLFTALAGGKQEVTWPDFHALFAQLEPGLLEEQLAQLWKTFDKNGDGGVSRDEFLTAFRNVKASAAIPIPAKGPVQPSTAKALALAEEVCSRVAALLRREGRTE
ncbi:unnamed protein product, partial [Polarella glacialis]